MKRILHYINTQYWKRLKNDLKYHLGKETASKVDFLICGAQKAGTTALDTYLRSHPEICMAEFKEVNYFDREKYFLYGKPDYSIYHSFFKPLPGQRIWGESTPIYMYWYQVPRRIWFYNPGMKIIIILRNPIERAFSHWNMQRERGFDPLPFQEALKMEERRQKESLPWQNRRFSYTDRGFYTEQIRRLRTYFPKKQLLLLRNLDLRHKPQWVLDQICSFLGVSPMEVEPLTRHQRKYPVEMQPEEKAYLKDLYQWEVRELEAITGWDCRDWLEY